MSFGQLVWSEGVAKNGIVVSSPKSDEGTWVVGDCFMAEFAMSLTVNTTLTNQTQFDVPPAAKADGSESNCGNETNTLSLTWSEPAVNDTSVDLNRKLIITFKKAKNDTMYGVSKIVATFEVYRWNVTENATTEEHGSTLEMVWPSNPDYTLMMFQVPVDRSYLCADISDVPLKTSLRYDGEFNKQLLNSSLTGNDVTFDAFRPAGHVPSKFRTPMDCDYKPNDIIPIAVGVALAGLVVAVLVAYMVGRRRNMQRGYQSV